MLFWLHGGPDELEPPLLLLPFQHSSIKAVNQNPACSALKALKMSRGTSEALLGFLCLAIAYQLATADHRNHIYKQGEHVVLYANKVGPFHNPRYVVKLIWGSHTTS